MDDHEVKIEVLPEIWERTEQLRKAVPMDAILGVLADLWDTMPDQRYFMGSLKRAVRSEKALITRTGLHVLYDGDVICPTILMVRSEDDVFQLQGRSEIIDVTSFLTDICAAFRARSDLERRIRETRDRCRKCEIKDMDDCEECPSMEMIKLGVRWSLDD